MTMNDDTVAPLDAALEYAERGLPVFPLNPRGKEPHGLLAPNGFKNATTDPEVIRGWWGEFPYANVAIAIPDHLMVIDVDPRNGGDATWQQLAQGRSVDTMTSVSGRGDGGFHLWLQRPDGALKSKLGDGVDVKAGGKGYIVAPPSIHPDSGEPYLWRNDGDPNAGEDWLVEAVVKPPPAPPSLAAAPAASQAGDGRPGDDFTAATTWDDLLLADGWKPLMRVGDEYRWTRPGKTTGVGCTINHTGTDRMKVFTSSVPGLEQDATYDRFGYYAATRHGGDHAAAARDLAAQGYGTQHQPIDLSWIEAAGRRVDLNVGVEDVDELARHGWEAVDLAAVLDEDYEPPKPELLRRTDGKALLYRGRINGLFGESGGGKSFISQRAIVEVISRHANVLVIDLEDHVGSYVARLLAMGLTRDIIRAHLTYISPELPLSDLSTVHLTQLVGQLQPELVVIDSTGEALSLQGVRPNEDDEVARWFRQLPRSLANLGPAVLLLDHVPKSDDAPKNYAIGSQRKRAAIDGALYRVEVGVAPVKGKTGRLKLICAKDRAGNWQHGTQVAEVTIVDSDIGTTCTVAEPSDPNRPTTLMIKVSDHLGLVGGVASRRQIDQGVSGKREYVVKAVDALIGEGYCREKQREGKGGGVDIELVKPFHDPVDNSWIEATVFSAPTAFSVSEHSSLTLAEPNCVFCAPRVIGHGGGNTVRGGQGPLEQASEIPNRVPQENAVRGEWSDHSGPSEPTDPYLAIDPTDRPSVNLEELF